MDIVIAGTADAVMMVEGGGNEIAEEDFLGAVEFAHAEIRKIIKAIDQLAKKVGKKKREYPLPAVDATSRSGCAKRSQKTSPKRCAWSTSRNAKKRSAR